MAKKTKTIDKSVHPAPGWRRSYADKGSKSRVVYVRDEKRVRSPSDTWRVHEAERGNPPEPKRRQAVTDADIIDIVIRETIMKGHEQRKAVIEDEMEAADVAFKDALLDELKKTTRGAQLCEMFPRLEADSLSDWHGFKVCFSMRGDSDRIDEVRGAVRISKAAGERLKKLQSVCNKLNSERHTLRDDQALRRRRDRMADMLKADADIMRQFHALVDAALIKHGGVPRAKVE